MGFLSGPLHGCMSWRFPTLRAGSGQVLVTPDPTTPQPHAAARSRGWGEGGSRLVLARGHTQRPHWTSPPFTPAAETHCVPGEAA